MPDSPPAHDIVVHGASGFVGRLTAEYLRDHAPRDVDIALSGRSASRLERVRDDLGGVAADWPILVADNASDADMARLAAATRVVASTVGPYERLGLPLVEACAARGTHYADLTGEVPFMRRSIDRADAVARESGARIVHTCGFDSIPSDVGVFLLARHAAEHGLGDLGDTTLVVVSIRGGISGGTIDSMRGLLDQARTDTSTRRLLFDPYALSPDRDAEPDTGIVQRDERDLVGVLHDDELGGWFAPFVMGRVNTRVVRRSNALQGHAYGMSLRYRELVRCGGLPLGPVKAGAIAGGIAAAVAGLAFPPTRVVLDSLLPDPGDGPGRRTRERGSFAIDVHTTTTRGHRLRCEIRVPGDPGYGATRVMLGEAALALAGDQDALDERTGVLTPVTGIGVELVRRLRAAGHRYDIVAP